MKFKIRKTIIEITWGDRLSFLAGILGSILGVAIIGIIMINFNLHERWFFFSTTIPLSFILMYKLEIILRDIQNAK